MSKPFLLLYRGGPASKLQVVDRAQAQNFDVALSWDSVQVPQVPGAAFVHAAPGSRWEGLAQTLASHADTLARYRHVWMPDEGVRWVSEDVSRLFTECDRLGLDLAQPAFASSPEVPPVARRHAGFQLRFTNAVDGVAPVVSRRLLGPIQAALRAGSGAAGWSKLVPPGRMAVIDAVEVALGAAPSGAGVEGACNLGGLLEGGEALCFSERAGDGDALIDAVVRACAVFAHGGASVARYLANHLEAPVTTQRTLERELAATPLQFNRRRPAATPPERPPELRAEEVDRLRREQPAERGAETRRRLALCEADLRDLRTRYARLVDERERQESLLATLAGRLVRVRELHLGERASAGEWQ
ncbi:MAG: hypothetical protein U1F50_04635 [Rubrivivax sp.]